MDRTAHETAVLGGGCFWCLDAVFRELDGVTGVESGYAGGTTEHPDYHAVCSGTTGHAEVVRVTFDPTVLSYDKLLHEDAVPVGDLRSDAGAEAHRGNARAGAVHRPIVACPDRHRDR